MRYIYICLFFICTLVQTKANNLQISTPTISDPTHITFTIQWDNSWRVSSGPASWDAVWVFIKYEDCSSNYLPWQHVALSTNASDHTVTGGILQVDVTSDGKGVFIRRAANGSGNISFATVTLKMNITDASYNYQVNGLEMAYVPQGNFSVGDGNRGNGSQFGFTGDGAMAPLIINATIQSTGLTAAQYLSNTSWGAATLPATFPFGYNGFYTMKYEISQKKYASFLNTLSYNQQVSRFSIAPNSTIGSFVLAGSPDRCRNSIKIATAGTSNTIPAIVGCDLNLNGTFDEAADGREIACNWLSWADLMAYLDWAALRPMTEFEFEKICRGSLAPVPNEYVWGTTNILAATAGAINNAGAQNEVSTLINKGLCAYSAGTPVNRGPLRCGFSATSTTDREFAGASYYGVLDMAGNVSEQCIGGQAGYNSFTNTNGDGILSNSGAADTPNWPVVGGGTQGGVMRGGNWYDIATFCITSNRDLIGNDTNNTRNYKVGGRGVRTY